MLRFAALPLILTPKSLIWLILVLATMTTLGIGDVSPARHTMLVKFLVTSEVLIGLYFWAVLVGTIIGWTVSEAKNDKSSPK